MSGEDLTFMTGAITGASLVLGYIVCKRLWRKYGSRSPIGRDKGPDNQQDAKQADTKDQTEMTAISSSKVDEFEQNENEESEMTVKEKFYMFLEKGFCPELEKGVDNPMYKYSRQYGDPPPPNEDEPINIFKAFCPVKEMFPGMESSSSDDETVQKTEDKTTVDWMREYADMMASADGQCPFFRKPSGDENFPVDGSSKKNMSSKSCPFQFGLGKDGTIKQGADLDEDNEKDKLCPYQEPESHSMCPDEKTRSVEDNTNAEQGINGSSDGNVSKLIGQTPLKSALLRTEPLLSDSEREAELKAQQEQVEAIMRLLEAQQQDCGVNVSAELQTQLKLYM